jgi:hypothetical protein
MLYIDEFASQHIARNEAVERDRALRRNERRTAPSRRAGLMARLAGRLADRPQVVPTATLECEGNAAAAR